MSWFGMKQQFGESPTDVNHMDYIAEKIFVQQAGIYQNMYIADSVIGCILESLTFYFSTINFEMEFCEMKCLPQTECISYNFFFCVFFQSFLLSQKKPRDWKNNW